MRVRKKQDLDQRLRSTKATGKGRAKDKAQAHKKFRARAAEVRARPWRIVAVLALVAALVGGVVFLFGWSTAFVVEEITTAGADGEVAELAQANAGVPIGRPMARVDTDAVEERVLQDLRVASVDVGRSWPSTLTLELTLRQPALVVRQSGLRGVLLADAQGVVYDTADEAPEDLPTVSAPKGDLEPAHLQAALTLPAALPAAVARKADDLRLDAAGRLQFTVGSVTVRWGDGTNAELKGRVLKGLLEQEGIDPSGEVDPVTGPIEIDLSTPSTPVVTGLQTASPTD
ncbi:cell division protein FtsQ/DivIB [Ornithinimicrobium cryptoxanthini]|uniref:cell division protein FtsQ/DivIB n=1 Tax=Ornithinimicrobium cryptoxanthini TaxID=2934161 RepID=UPI0021199DFE|nr:FtsQ-type POTRA domain-containing protein [Ornithinimicrobium cryptoxanthini]